MGVEGWIHARSVTFTCLDAGQEAGWGRGVVCRDGPGTEPSYLLTHLLLFG